MVRLRIKLALFNLLSKIILTLIFLLIMPWLIERINLIQVDNDLIDKREKVIKLISEIGIEPFMTADTVTDFGSYNILKEEFISLESQEKDTEVNYIDVAPRIIDGEEIEYRVLNYSLKIDGKNYILEVGQSLESILHNRRNISTLMIVFMISVIIITLITELQYTRAVLKPLNAIINKLKGISNPLTFDKLPVNTTTSDFYRLDKAIREMMESINDLFNKEKDITINISHELLTPVSVIRSKLENLLLQNNIDETIAEKIEESLKTLHRLQGLVNSLLMIARIESRQYIRDENVMICELLRETGSELNPVAEDAGITVGLELNADLEFKDANRPLLISMFFNIINNAIRNTPPGGIINIRSLVEENRFKVIISDTGSGMTEEQLNTLFSRFSTRLDIKNNNTGIGLAIAKSIADFHGINIRVFSRIEEGSSFCFIFPQAD